MDKYAASIPIMLVCLVPAVARGELPLRSFSHTVKGDLGAG
jgi:hypothetical protein